MGIESLNRCQIDEYLNLDKLKSIQLVKKLLNPMEFTGPLLKKRSRVA